MSAIIILFRDFCRVHTKMDAQCIREIDLVLVRPMYIAIKLI